MVGTGAGAVVGTGVAEAMRPEVTGTAGEAEAEADLTIKAGEEPDNQLI